MIEAKESNENSIGSKSEYTLTNKNIESESTFDVSILCNSEGYIDQIVTSAYNDLSKKMENDRNMLFEKYTIYCIYGLIMSLDTQLEFGNNVEEYAESLVADRYILELNIKYEMIDSRTLGINGYISPIDGGFKISDVFKK